MARELSPRTAAHIVHFAEHRRQRVLGAEVDGLVGTRQTVLIENSEKGHSDGFAPVRVAGSKRGELGNAKIVSRDADHLIGIFE